MTWTTMGCDNWNFITEGYRFKLLLVIDIVIMINLYVVIVINNC